MTPGAALLFPDHPYNVAYDVLNTKFLGANQLIAIADTRSPDSIKTGEPLELMEEYGAAMEEVEGAALSVSVVDVIRQLARLYHEGEPKWGFIPNNPKDIAQLFYTFTQSGQAGDLDRFVDPSYQFGTVVTLFRGHSNAIITNAIEQATTFARNNASDAVQFRLAGGIFGILAAVNEKVEDSYWTTLTIVFAVVAVCLYLTYGSLTATFLLMVPVVGSQFLCEAVMVLLLSLLMLFNTVGGLIVVPALVKVMRPAFLLKRRDLALASGRIPLETSGA